MSRVPTVTLAKGREKSVLKRHPWIFSGGIQATDAAISPGATVAVLSARGDFLGYGSYSPESQIRVRMLSFAREEIPDADFLARRIEQAVARREHLLAKEKAGVRLIHAEADHLPGVIADWYDGYIVCQFSFVGADYWKKTITETLFKIPGAKGVSLRNDVDSRRKEGLATSDELEVVLGVAPPARIEIVENDLRLWVDVRLGHKTGFYLDQREARALVGSLSRDREVLNCFSYTGGFGLAASRGGAKHVTQVDISKEAIALARENALLNEGALEKTDFVEADVFHYLRTCRDARRTFDLIVLDPPKFAESKGHVMKAARGYKDINLLAMKLLRPGGILATFSCSGAMTTDLFDQVVLEASLDAARDFQVIARTRQAADHPVALTFPEGFYLKGLILRAIDG